MPDRKRLNKDVSQKNEMEGAWGSMSFIAERDLQFARDAFRSYYRRPKQHIEIPRKIEKREFGYFVFGEKIMVRHISLTEANSLTRIFIDRAPLHAYYSSAFFHSPSVPMEKKGWMGAELVFDIDADHLPVGCKADHDFWLCKSCGKYGPKPAPKKCPTCQREVEEIEWLCEICLREARNELLKLLDFLELSLGIRSKDITLNFSGHRGYHLHVDNDHLNSMDQFARKEIVDYVTGNGLDLSQHGLYISTTSGTLIGPEYSDPSWRGKIARGVYDLLGQLPDPSYEAQFRGALTSKIYRRFLKRQEALMKLWSSRPVWGVASGIKPDDWIKLAELAVRMQAARIDTVVTTDVHRLIRMINTLHGKTGLLSLRIDHDEVEDFDPFRDSVVFPDHPSIKMKVLYSPRFRIKDKTYGPYHNEVVEVPFCTAMFMVCKGVSTISSG